MTRTANARYRAPPGASRLKSLPQAQAPAWGRLPEAALALLQCRPRRARHPGPARRKTHRPKLPLCVGAAGAVGATSVAMAASAARWPAGRHHPTANARHHALPRASRLKSLPQAQGAGLAISLAMRECRSPGRDIPHLRRDATDGLTPAAQCRGSRASGDTVSNAPSSPATGMEGFTPARSNPGGGYSRYCSPSDHSRFGSSCRPFTCR